MFFRCTNQLFDIVPQRTTAVRRFLLHGGDTKPHEVSVIEHAKHGRFREALESFRRINNHGINPTKFTLCRLLTSCTALRDHHLGLQIHAWIIRTGYQGNIFLNSKLIDLYAKCDMIADARRVFDSIEEHDHVSWTSIITGFAQNGYGAGALVLFKQMLGNHIRPNSFTLATVISACPEIESTFEQVSSFHAHVIKLGCECNNYVLCSLIACYSKCGKIHLAMILYNGIIEGDVTLMDSMIAAYSQNLCGEEALQIFVEMKRSDIYPTDYTFSGILNACASLTLLHQGRQIHSLIVRGGSEQSVFVASSLIDMYSKCGNIDEARSIFDQLAQKNSILWTSMITGYAHAGRGADGLDLFEQLVKQKDIKPDNICFTAVLTACNHIGLVDRATSYFNKMSTEYGVTPQIDQYACMVDLYGKTGQLMKAKKMIEDMPWEPNVVMLSSFLGSCRVYGEVELGREAASQLFKMDPYNAAPYVTLANIYAEAGIWEEVLQVRKLMKENGARKNAGWSWTEVENRVHVFSVGDTSHPQLQYIYAELDKLTLEMMKAGYKPMLKYVLDDNTYECI